MPDFCTCGAQLPDDAVFCHKCGKPQRDIAPVEPEPPRAEWQTAPPDVVAPPPAEGPPLNFHNAPAVRIAFLVAAVATLAGVTVLPIVSWPTAGFVSVLFYRRRTGLRLNARSGARMGWITGILMSLFWVVIIAGSMLPAAFSGHLVSTLESQMKSLPGVDPSMIQQELHFLQTPAGLALVMSFGLVFFAVVITFLSMAGGALGAKLVGDSNPPRGGRIA